MNKLLEIACLFQIVFVNYRLQYVAVVCCKQLVYDLISVALVVHTPQQMLVVTTAYQPRPQACTVVDAPTSNERPLVQHPQTASKASTVTLPILAQFRQIISQMSTRRCHRREENVRSPGDATVMSSKSSASATAAAAPPSMYSTKLANVTRRWSAPPLPLDDVRQYLHRSAFDATQSAICASLRSVRQQTITNSLTHATEKKAAAINQSIYQSITILQCAQKLTRELVNVVCRTQE